MAFLATLQAKVFSKKAEVVEVAPTTQSAFDEKSGSVDGKGHGIAVQEPSLERALSEEKPVNLSDDPSGVARIEAVQRVWGTHGKYLLWAGLAMMMLVFELDNATIYNYQNYASSSFDKLSLVATLSTASTIVSAIVKPPIAKISDVIGRGETYIFTISCYILSYVLCAKASTFNMYAAGAIFYSIGQSGTQILDQVRNSPPGPVH
jgi:hypothetical protein